MIFCKRILIMMCMGLLVAFASCSSRDGSSGPQGRPGQRGPAEVDGFIVRTRSISEKIEVPGSLLPAEQTEIRSEVSGRVIQLNFREGSMVESGALLVKLFDGDLQNQLKKLEIQLQIAEKTEERQSELLKINGISQQEFDLVSLNVQTLKVDIEATKIAIAKTEIRAPYRGQVGLRNISLGAFISPNELITTLRQISNLKLEFSIPEKYAREIQKGNKVSFKVDGGTQSHSATILATENSVEQTTRTLRVRAVVNSHHPELVSGVFANVNLQLGKDNQALMIPTQAIIPTARNKQVVICRGDSAVFSVVETGIRDSSFVQVLSGIQPGDTIITSGLMVVRPNAKLKIKKIE